MLCSIVDYMANVTPDLDPEDVTPYANDDEESELEEDEGIDESRAHYETVEESKLRKRQAISLGPQYSGSRISRIAVEDEDEDDPFSRGFNEEESEEEELENDIQSEDDIETSNEESEEEEGPKSNGYPQPTGGIDRAEIRKLMAEDHKNVAANLSQSARADGEKGQAVKKQRVTFDALLNLRIKLQKALISVNSIPLAGKEENATSADESAIRKAEDAAIILFNNLSSLRAEFDSARTGKKRKHAEITSSDDLSPTWNELKDIESDAVRQRNSTLDFWSAKCRATTATIQTRKLGATQTERSLSDVLNGHLSDTQRLVSRTRVPRSCAPLQAAQLSKKNHHDAPPSDAGTQTLPIYDDADFYTLLLQQLISQRSDDSTSLSALNMTAMEPWQAAREAKARKVVDNRASKGRKLKYTVHEKLMNFMAPEDRNAWESRQCEELFGSLFGRKVELGENEDIASEGEEDDKEVEGLRLFAGV